MGHCFSWESVSKVVYLKLEGRMPVSAHTAGTGVEWRAPMMNRRHLFLMDSIV